MLGANEGDLAAMMGFMVEAGAEDELADGDRAVGGMRDGSLELVKMPLNACQLAGKRIPQMHEKLSLTFTEGEAGNKSTVGDFAIAPQFMGQPEVGVTDVPGDVADGVASNVGPIELRLAQILEALERGFASSAERVGHPVHASPLEGPLSPSSDGVLIGYLVLAVPCNRYEI